MPAYRPTNWEQVFWAVIVIGGLALCALPAVLLSLELDALDRAAMQRGATDGMHHSDQGSQYSAFAFGQRCRTLGVRPSMGSRGDAYDNAMAESFFSTLDCKCLAKHRFTSHTEARMVLFRCAEGWYNPHRRHSAPGQRSPLAFEHLHAVPSNAA